MGTGSPTRCGHWRPAAGCWWSEFTGGEIPTVKVNRLLLNNVDVVGAGWGAWTLSHPGYLAEQWAELEPLLASGRVPAPEPEVYPLERAGEAIASLENRTARGKVVLKVR